MFFSSGLYLSLAYKGGENHSETRAAVLAPLSAPPLPVLAFLETMPMLPVSSVRHLTPPRILDLV